MPIYSYECQHCQTTFEVQMTFKEKEIGLEPECPQCQRIETKQLLTVVLSIHCGSGMNTGLPLANLGPIDGPGCCK